MKKFFEEPEVEVVRFNAKDAFIATSETPITDENKPSQQGCEGDGCEGDEED